MTATLKISFEARNLGQVRELPVVLRVLDERMEIIEDPQIVTPDAPCVSHVSAGTRVVTADFPSGHTLRHIVRIEDDSLEEIIFDTGQLNLDPGIERAALLAPAIRTLAGHPNVQPQEDDGTWLRLWNRKDELSWALTDLRGQLIVDTGKISLYWFESPAGDNLIQIGGPDTPLRMVRVPAVQVVDIAIAGAGRDAHPVWIATQDNLVEGMLGFLLRGEGEGAALVAARLLQSVRTPLRSIILGYYYLRIGDNEQFLALDFGESDSWRADSLVLSAWQDIRRARLDAESDTTHLQGAARKLFEVEELGLPVYTEGLWLLIDGLRGLRRLDELRIPAQIVELEDRLRRLEPYATSIDRLALTTTFLGRHPTEPSATFVFDEPVSPPPVYLRSSLVKAPPEVQNVSRARIQPLPEVTTAAARRLIRVNAEAAEALLREAVRGDYFPAYVELAALVRERNRDEAETLLRRAVKAHLPSARTDLALLLKDRNMHEAEQLLSGAVKQMYWPAFVELAALVRERRKSESEALLRRAAGGGFPRAMYELAMLLKESKPAEAEKLLGRAVKGMYLPAFVELAAWVRDTDEEEEERLLRMAAEAGFPPAMGDLGQMLREKDPVEAELWLRDASRADDLMAMNNLGVFLIEKSPDEGIRLIQRAADLGLQKAIDNVAVLRRSPHRYRSRRLSFAAR